MLFHTWHFLIFFLIVYLVYFQLRKTRFYLTWLLASSYFFYGWWNPLYLILILYSTAIDYFAVLLMDKDRKRKKFWFIVSIINNLLLLGFFKYASFITNNLNIFLANFGAQFTISCPNILLPVGISFYVFQTMSYAIDFYKGNIKREPSFIRFATFVSLFPQLVAGPIERASNLLPQLNSAPKIFLKNISDGLSLFMVGLFKKVALADYLALYVDKVYTAPDSFNSASLILATLAFGWQIYFDFSGYTDMARGIAEVMGFKLMLNFNNPYLATSLGDFWVRWHISLSSWFKDYVYIPLGGNRDGEFNTYRNMFITMTVSGLWHGASWTFIIWGVIHAIGRCLTRKFEMTKFYNEKIPKLVRQFTVFSFVTFAWIFFRAENLGDALLIIERIFNFKSGDPNFPLVALFFCLFTWIYQSLFESRFKNIVEWRPVKISAMIFIFLYLVIFTTSSHEAFIYFQF